MEIMIYIFYFNNKMLILNVFKFAFILLNHINRILILEK